MKKKEANQLLIVSFGFLLFTLVYFLASLSPKFYSEFFHWVAGILTVIAFVVWIILRILIWRKVI